MSVLIRVIEFLSAATAVLIAAVAIFGYFQKGIPTIEIAESCTLSWPQNPEATPDEILALTKDRLWNFYENIDAFAVENDGRIVYADIKILANDSALGCAIANQDISHFIPGNAPEFIPFDITIGEDAWGEEMVFSLVGPYGGSWNFLLPAQRKLPKNGQYRAIDFGYLVSLEGPFLIEHQSMNGYGVVTLHPQTERVLSENEINCTRWRLSIPKSVRHLAPCF